MELKIAQQSLDAGEGLEIRSFGMDTTIAMIALREKIYANPRRAAVQEYLSNARDANREAGRGTVPVEVFNPTPDNPCMIFRDNGIGINPDRMHNVFTHYGKSTKRDSNAQTGGWGLGCKAGFAVSDQFTVVTTWEEGGKILKASYVMLITPDQRSSFAQLGETEECPAGTLTGTEIHLPIDEDDVDEFLGHVESIAMYWGHPLVENSATPILSWTPCDDRWGKEHSKEEHSGNWILVSEDTSSYHRRARNENGHLVIDGITYTLRMDALQRAGLTTSEMEFMRRTISFYKTGEIMVTATREDIDYGSPQTVETLQSQVEVMTAHIRKELENVMNTAKDYIQASKLVAGMRSRFGSLFGDCWKEVRWRDGNDELMLFDFAAEMPNTAFEKYRVLKIERNRHADSGFNQAEVNKYRVPKYEDNIFVVCDVGRSRNNKIRGVLATLPTVIRHGVRQQADEFFLICPRGTQQKLTEPKKVLAEFGLERMGCRNLSNYEEVKMVRKNERSATHPENLARICVINGGSRHNIKWDRTTRDVTRSGGGVYVFYYREKGYYDRECTREVSNMDALCKLSKRVFGISPKAADKIHKDWLHIDKYVEVLRQRVEEKYRPYLGLFSVSWLSSMNEALRDVLKKYHQHYKYRHTDPDPKLVVEWPHYCLDDTTALGKLVRLHEERIQLGDHKEYYFAYADHAYGQFQRVKGARKKNPFNLHGHGTRERMQLHRRADVLRDALDKFCKVTCDDAVEAIEKDYPLLDKLTRSDANVREIAAYILGKDQIRARKSAA